MGLSRLSGLDPALTYKLSAGPVPPNHASQATAHALLPHDPPTFSLSIDIKGNFLSPLKCGVNVYEVSFNGHFSSFSGPGRFSSLRMTRTEEGLFAGLWSVLQ